MDLSRRRLLQGDLRDRSLPPRPPWAVAEETFTRHCTRCDDCIRACEDGLLVRGSGGFPEIRFDECGCSFCGDCLNACPTGALSAPHPAPAIAWNWRAHIGSQCLDLRGIVCRACGDACEVRAIRFKLAAGGRAEPEVNLALCNGCGECVAICPENAVSLLDPIQTVHDREENG